MNIGKLSRRSARMKSFCAMCPGRQLVSILSAVHQLRFARRMIGERTDRSIPTPVPKVCLIPGHSVFGLVSVRPHFDQETGRSGTNQHFLPQIAPLILVALLFTIFTMFSRKGDMVVHLPLDLIRSAIPLAIYFVECSSSVSLPEDDRANYGKTTVAAFTVASNNLELAIAVVIAALVSVCRSRLRGERAVGRSSALISLVSVAMWCRGGWFCCLARRPANVNAQQ